MYKYFREGILITKLKSLFVAVYSRISFKNKYAIPLDNLITYGRMFGK